MELNMDTIQFESRREIEAVMVALEAWLKKNPDDSCVKDLFNKLDVMHMNW